MVKFAQIIKLCYNMQEMKLKYIKHNVSLFGLLVGVLTITGMGLAERGMMAPKTEAAFARKQPERSYAAPVAVAPVPNTALYRQAKRLRTRIQRLSMSAPPLDALAHALAMRRELLTHSVNVQLEADDGKELAAWTVSLHRYPTWLTGNFSMNRADFTIDQHRIESYLRENPPEEVLPPVNTVISDIIMPEEGAKEPLRVKTEGIAKSGYTFDAKQTAHLLAASLYQGSESLSVPVTLTPGRVINTANLDLGNLELLASGLSNFQGSISGRVANVKKGLSERVNNVLVAPGETFSFNSTLGSMTASAGWYEALGIFEGDQLRPVTGGGICQVATTVYRAILNAGLPVVKRKAHSLYVVYYEQHGFGLDATIYPGQQDLTFLNDTGNYILVQSYYDGFDATVNFYGTSDGRSVVMEGPYFTANAPEDLLEDGRKVRGNEIAWIRTITHSDGTTAKETIMSRYKFLPKNVVSKHVELQRTAALPQEEPTHTAASDLLSETHTGESPIN